MLEKREIDIEKRVQKKVRRERIQDAVLLSVYLATMAGAIVIMPNALRLFKNLHKKLIPNRRLAPRINQAYSRLIAAGMLERVGSERGAGVRLTEKGRSDGAHLHLFQKLKSKQSKKWDRRWRIIMFDVWEKRHSTRTTLRSFLVEAGFVKLQGSVWVYPYPCEELLVFLRTDLRLGRGILYVVADEIEHDEVLRHHFKLPLE